VSSTNIHNGTQTAPSTRPPLDTNPPKLCETGENGANGEVTAAVRLIALEMVADLAALAGRRAGRLALTKAEAAEALSMSVDSFERYVQGQVRLVRLGRLVLVPVTELERWLEANASLTLEELA
jgi:excisionase family DNA binding protein